MVVALLLALCAAVAVMIDARGHRGAGRTEMMSAHQFIASNNLGTSVIQIESMLTGASQALSQASGKSEMQRLALARADSPITATIVSPQLGASPSRADTASSPVEASRSSDSAYAADEDQAMAKEEAVEANHLSDAAHIKEIKAEISSIAEKLKTAKIDSLKKQIAAEEKTLNLMKARKLGSRAEAAQHLPKTLSRSTEALVGRPTVAGGLMKLAKQAAVAQEKEVQKNERFTVGGDDNSAVRGTIKLRHLGYVGAHDQLLDPSHSRQAARIAGGSWESRAPLAAQVLHIKKMRPERFTAGKLYKQAKEEQQAYIAKGRREEAKDVEAQTLVAAKKRAATKAQDKAQAHRIDSDAAKKHRTPDGKMSSSKRTDKKMTALEADKKALAAAEARVARIKAKLHVAEGIATRSAKGPGLRPPVSSHASQKHTHTTRTIAAPKKKIQMLAGAAGNKMVNGGLDVAHPVSAAAGTRTKHAKSLLLQAEEEMHREHQDKVEAKQSVVLQEKARSIALQEKALKLEEKNIKLKQQALEVRETKMQASEVADGSKPSNEKDDSATHSPLHLASRVKTPPAAAPAATAAHARKHRKLSLIQQAIAEENKDHAAIVGEKSADEHALQLQHESSPAQHLGADHSSASGATAGKGVGANSEAESKEEDKTSSTSRLRDERIGKKQRENALLQKRIEAHSHEVEIESLEKPFMKKKADHHASASHPHPASRDSKALFKSVAREGNALARIHDSSFYSEFEPRSPQLLSAAGEVKNAHEAHLTPRLKPSAIEQAEAELHKDQILGSAAERETLPPAL